MLAGINTLLMYFLDLYFYVITYYIPYYSIATITTQDLIAAVNIYKSVFKIDPNNVRKRIKRGNAK